jgi:hypothetical protein
VNGGAVAGGARIVREQDVGEALARRVPRAQKYLGWPLLWWMELAP